MSIIAYWTPPASSAPALLHLAGPGRAALGTIQSTLTTGFAASGRKAKSVGAQQHLRAFPPQLNGDAPRPLALLTTMVFMVHAISAALYGYTYVSPYTSSATLEFHIIFS